MWCISLRALAWRDDFGSESHWAVELGKLVAIDILGMFEDIHETGTTVLFATHDRTLLDVRPRRVVVLDEGKATDVPNGLERDATDEDDDFGDVLRASA